MHKGEAMLYSREYHPSISLARSLLVPRVLDLQAITRFTYKPHSACSSSSLSIRVYYIPFFYLLIIHFIITNIKNFIVKNISPHRPLQRLLVVYLVLDHLYHQKQINQHVNIQLHFMHYCYHLSLYKGV